MTTEKALSVILNGNSIFSGAIFVYNDSVKITEVVET